MSERMRHRPVQSCTQCKQLKSRCDAKVLFPQPCTRCRNKKLDCVVDANFRRTPTRERISQMERELEKLRFSANPSHMNSSHSIGSHRSSHGTDARDDDSTSPPVTSLGAFGSSAGVFDEVEVAQIGACRLNPEDIVIIFSTYATHFNHHLPILDPSMTVASIYKSNRFLFWTVVVIVTQRLPARYSQIWAGLIDPYKDLLGRVAISSPLTLLSIQGLLLICTWPLPVEFQPRDQSWNLSGIAVNAALYMGLNKPGQAQSLRSIGVFAQSPVRSITWLACFHVSVWTSQFVGVLPPLHSPRDIKTISQIVLDSSMPKEFIAIVEISRCVATYIPLLSESQGDVLSARAETVFEQELDITKTRYGGIWSQYLDTYFLQAKLHMFIIIAINQENSLHDSETEPNHGHAQISHRTQVLQGFECATKFIDILIHVLTYPIPSHEFYDQSALKTEIYNGGTPKFLYHGGLSATFYLLRYIFHSEWALQSQREVARKRIVSVHSYLSQLSVAPNDEASRAAAVIATLLKSPPADGVTGAELRVKDRLASSLRYDAVAMAAELRNRQTHLDSDQQVPQNVMGLDQPSLPTVADDASGGNLNSTMFEAGNMQENVDATMFDFLGFSLDGSMTGMFTGPEWGDPYSF